MAEPTNQPRSLDIALGRARASDPETVLRMYETAIDQRDRYRRDHARLEAQLVAAETQRREAEKAITDAMAYARDRKLECRRDAAFDDDYEFIGMANAFAEMAEHLHSALAVLAASRQEPSQ